MSKPTFEGPQLGIKTLKASPSNWQSKGLGDTSRVLTLSMTGESPFFPTNVAYSSWEHLEPGQITIDSPDANYDAVYLTNILDRYTAEEQKRLIAEAARVTKNNGRIVAYSPACDDAEEVRELARQYGMDTKEFDSRRLTNRDIVRLRPNDAMFFLGKIVIPNRHRLVKVLQSLGLPATLEHMWEVRDRFVIRRFHVGMAWTVQRG